MTIEAVQEFFTKVGEDESLARELVTALNAEDDRGAVTELGNSKGYDFTSDELWAEVQRRQAQAQARADAGELSDEELEAVAGGEIIMATISIATFATLITINVGTQKGGW